MARIRIKIVQAISQKIISIGNDHLSGSSEICLKLAKIVKSEIIKIENKKKLRIFLDSVEKFMISSKPDMLILFNFFKKLKLLEHISVDIVLNAIDEFTKVIKIAPIVIAKKLQLRFKKIKTLMTYSASSTVEKVIKLLYNAGCSFEVIVCESRPLYEGKRLAKRLVKENISTILATEAVAFSNISKVDALVTGADMVGIDFFRNKIGSKALFELAFLYDIESYVLCEKYKISKKKAKEEIELNYIEKSKYLKILNPCFENVSLSLVKNLITC